ncbi:hypothetical protein EIK77_005464 [Talaromyces pinophilus]|nr:hypothetical protein EIK77_005464 [Talaromyces pinophilus]
MTEEPKPSLPSFQESFQELMSPDPRISVRQTLPPGSLKPLGRPGQNGLPASNVGRYTIPPPNNIDFLQAPTSAAAGSPENSQNLPSIAQALASLDSGATLTHFTVPTPIPQFSRGQSTLSTMLTGSTPCSHPSSINSKDLSVTSPLPQSPYVMQPSSLAPDTSNMTAYSEASLRGVTVGGGPTRSYSLPTELRAAEDRSEGLNSGTNMHKCPYPGCTAGAFPTQYLLKYVLPTP